MNPEKAQVTFSGRRAVPAARKGNHHGAVFGGLRWGWRLGTALGIFWSAGAGAQELRFLQPTNGAVFSTLDEVPIVLRASAPNDVFFTAEVLSDVHHRIGQALYCCPICLCVRPEPGQETTLQLPGNYKNAMPVRMWQGWTNVPAGEHTLTAKAVGENGTALEAEPVTIFVLDRSLRIHRGENGSMVLSIAQGSMVRGRYDLEMSEDLATWQRLGPFSPGAVAAFYWDAPPASARVRFYRAVYIAPE